MSSPESIYFSDNFITQFEDVDWEISDSTDRSEKNSVPSTQETQTSCSPPLPGCQGYELLRVLSSNIAAKKQD